MQDNERIELLHGFLEGLSAAISQDDADVRGYYLWSLMDNFEWSFGYGNSFGLLYTDYATQRRVAKASAEWYARVISRNGLD